MIKLDQMRVFDAVARHGSLSAAARELRRTPSALSMSLSQLESHLGDRLFETERKNRLTALGQRVAQECRRAVTAHAQSADAIGRHARSSAGVIRIAAVPSALGTVLAGALTRFRSDRAAVGAHGGPHGGPHGGAHGGADVRLEISDVDSAGVRDRIGRDLADIGIVSAPAQHPAPPDTILTDRLGIVHAPGGPIDQALREGRAPAWTLLTREPLIANPLCALVDHPCPQALLPDCTLEARNTTALLAFVRTGLGATILPESALHGHADLCLTLPDHPPAARHLVKVQARDRHLNPAAQRFWDLL